LFGQMEASLFSIVGGRELTLLYVKRLGIYIYVGGTGVPALVSSRKMTLKLNYIYMKTL
jgi:hypothetical protein